MSADTRRAGVAMLVLLAVAGLVFTCSRPSRADPPVFAPSSTAPRPTTTIPATPPGHPPVTTPPARPSTAPPITAQPRVTTTTRPPVRTTTTEPPQPAPVEQPDPDPDPDPDVDAPRRERTGNSGHPCLPGERDGDGDGYCGEGR